MRTWAFLVFAAIVVPACGDNGNNNGPQDAGLPIDASIPITIDAQPIDAQPIDAGKPIDAGPVDLCAGNTCDDGDPCNGQETCNPDDGSCFSGDAEDDGTACGTPTDPDHVCVATICSLSKCGNGLVEFGEQCDGGPGCKNDCTFVCSDDPATQCAGMNLNPGECGQIGCAIDHTCAVLADTAKSGTACTTSGGTVCVAGTCGSPGCGDGKLDTAKGEECDDGDHANFDGCDSSCKLEQVARITHLVQQFAPDTFCTQDALGTAILPDGQGTIQGTWAGPVGDGSLSVVFKFLGLNGPLGPTSSQDFELGFANASPVPYPPPCDDPTDPATCPVPVPNGNSDLDWWYVLDPARPLVSAAGVPLSTLRAHIDGGHITSQPGDITVKILFAFEPAFVTLFHTVVDAQIDPAISVPLVSTGDPPGHLASEHLDPNLTTFVSSPSGKMCSNVSVQSLFDTPIPNLLAGTCATDAAGAHKIFHHTNTLFDVFVNGCAVFGTPAIQATQPDGSVSGATYHFEVSPTTHGVVSCTRDGAPAELTDCVKDATYSSSFTFTSDRVIIHRN